MILARRMYGFYALYTAMILALPHGFVYLKDVEPSIVQDIRYASSHNFTGRVVPGYQSAACILTKQAADALKKAQHYLQPFGLGLKVYDCYRPQQAVYAFIAWSQDATDTLMRQEFYPRVDKRNVFKEGYVAKRSSHTRGSTVDITLILQPATPEAAYHTGDALQACNAPADKRFTDHSLDFGTGYDCFDMMSHPTCADLTTEQKQRRLLLKLLMQKFGFVGIATEWWHFTLKHEPFKDTYFDFVVR